MPAGPLFGAPNGFIAATDEAHTQALTGLAKAETSSIQHKMAQDDAMMQLMKMSGTEGGGETNPADALEKRGEMLLRGGFFQQGSKLVEQAELMRTQQMSQEHQRSEIKKAEAAQKEKEGRDLLELIAPATDEESWQKALMTWSFLHPGQKVPPQMMHYDPKVQEVLVHATKSGLARMKEEQKDYEIDQRDRQIAQKEDLQKKNEAFRERLEKYKQDRADARKKMAGGSSRVPSIGEPNANMIRGASAILKEKYPGLAADFELRKDELVPSAAYDIATEAKARMAANRGLSAGEAMQQVMQDFEAAGALNKTPEDPGAKVAGFHIPGTGTPAKSTYTRGGAKAQPLPTSKGELKDGVLYETAKGVVKWDAKKQKGIPVTMPKTGTKAPVTTADADDEDEDE